MSSWFNSTAVIGYLAIALSALPVAAQSPTPTPSTADDLGTISGRVVDAASGRPISDVLLRVDGTSHETLSDPNGLFSLDGIEEGEQRLVLEHLSYGEHARRVLVRPGENLTLEARISTRAIELAPLVVEALTELERRRITGGTPIREVTREELDLAQSTGRNLAEILRERIPGTSVRRGRFGLSCVEYRGARTGSGACRDLTVFVDGVRIAEPGSFYDLVPPENIERMEVLSIAEAGARYGSISGNGVLLIETRRPPTPNRPADATVQSAIFDWSGEARPYPWKRVFASSFVANAVGVGVSLALADQCFWRAEAGSLGLRTSCGGAATAGIGFLSLALPAIGGGLAAQWGGTTPFSQGRLTPASLASGIGVASGYMLLIHGTGSSEVLSAVVLGLGVPVMTTLADRIFRSHH